MNAYLSNPAAPTMLAYIELHICIYAYYDGLVVRRGDDAYRGIEVGLWPPDKGVAGDYMRNLGPVVRALLVNCLCEEQPLGVGQLVHRR